jgi:hypothetical protein
MRPDDPVTPEERVHELAGILAAAILRLHIRGALQAVPTPKNLSDSSLDCLELAPEDALTVHTG